MKIVTCALVLSIALALLSFLAPPTFADPNYVRRPLGWFLLFPPLTKPDPVTGFRYVDDSAPQAKWFGMVIRGYDGHDYDFVDQHACEVWKTNMFEQFYHPFSGTEQQRFADGWVQKSQCVKDDKRHRVVSGQTQLARMMGLE